MFQSIQKPVAPVDVRPEVVSVDPQKDQFLNELERYRDFYLPDTGENFDVALDGGYAYAGSPETIPLRHIEREMVAKGLGSLWTGWLEGTIEALRERAEPYVPVPVASAVDSYLDDVRRLSAETEGRVPMLEVEQMARAIVELSIRHRPAGELQRREEFRLDMPQWKGLRWRVRCDEDAENPNERIFICRQVSRTCPRIEQIALPPFLREATMCENWNAGGLILLIAATGQGKSTTLAGIVSSRLNAYSGHTRSVEDPIELPLSGFHGKGFCVQSEVDYRLPRATAWGKALLAAMRQFPSINRGKILLLGEVRDGITACESLQAAVSGHLVLTTVHAGSVIEGIRRFGNFAEQLMTAEAARTTLGSVFRVGVHQRLEWMPQATGWARGVIRASYLVGKPTDDKGSPSEIANMIARGEYTKLNSATEQLNSLINQIAPGQTYEQMDAAKRMEKFMQILEKMNA